MVQQDGWHLRSTRMQVRCPAWHRGLRSRCCHSCGLGHNCASNLLPGLGKPYALGQRKKQKEPKKQKQNKTKKTHPKQKKKQKQQQYLQLEQLNQWKMLPPRSRNEAGENGRLLVFPVSESIFTISHVMF